MFGISCKDKRTFILLELLLPCPINVFFCGFDCILRSVWLGPYWKVSQLSKIFRIDDVVLASSQLHILGEKSDLNNLVPCWQSSEELQNCNLKRGWPSCWLYCKSILTLSSTAYRMEDTKPILGPQNSVPQLLNIKTPKEDIWESPLSNILRS